MENTIPKVIHQIWSGINEPLPTYFRVLGDTWKEHHADWHYEFWDNDKMNGFLEEHYPHYLPFYQDFKYNVQRWDVIRYLILYKFGGMYVDFDYECIMPMDPLLKGKLCCFSMEPKEHAVIFNKESYFNNALMAVVPGHPFMLEIIKRVFKKDAGFYEDKMMEVLQTTGPLMLMDVYEQYLEKEEIYLIPPEYVSPFTKYHVNDYIRRRCSQEMLTFLDKRLKKAYAIHYFMGTWT